MNYLCRTGTLFGGLEVVTPSTGLVVSVERAKRHCRVDHSDDDAYFANDLIPAAQEYVERAVDGGIQLLPATYDWPLSTNVGGWWADPLALPRPPLQSVTWVKYYDANGVQQTLSSSLYSVRTPQRGPGRVERVGLTVWPTGFALGRPYPITVRFVAGFASAAVVPGTLKMAVLLLVGHWYVNREGVLTGETSKEIEFAVSSLLETNGWGFHG
jgi:uncharacterized phiE125 gp8 family phage protein